MAQGDAEESVEPALDSQIQPCHSKKKKMMSYCMVNEVDTISISKNFFVPLI